MSGFPSGNEPPRPFGEVLAERRAQDPVCRVREQAFEKIAELEADAAAAATPAERKHLQCEAEGLRAALNEKTR